ncbi:uncharacterized protein LOC142827898 [Pelodiscus sinensis]|uniref:uncharacterized protein LOC142827898 n=1 Tax=Pelodiscus sinensis TaxID=13735 RepID=UPI003F6CAD7D
MEPAKVLEWVMENQRQQQQQQTQIVQQLAAQFQEQQRQLVRELTEHQQAVGARRGRGEAPWPGEEDTAGGVQPPVRLAKLGPADDVEAFLVTFERVATAARWPEEHWATIVAPYLSGPAQMAYRGLPAREALHYYKVKEAILDQVGITPETYRQRFRQERYRPGDRPRAVAHRLKESGMRWLEPEPKTGMQVAELVILEQFIQVLPGEGQRWVRRHRPSTLAEAVTLMEDFVAAEGTEERGKNPVSGPPGRASIASKGPAGRGERRQSAEPGPVWGRKLAPVWRNPAEEPRAEKRGLAPEGDNGRKVGPPNKLVCFQCGQEGHFRRECPVMDCTFGRVMTSEAQKAKPLPSKVMARVKVGGPYCGGTGGLRLRTDDGTGRPGRRGSSYGRAHLDAVCPRGRPPLSDGLGPDRGRTAYRDVASGVSPKPGVPRPAGIRLAGPGPLAPTMGAGRDITRGRPRGKGAGGGAGGRSPGPD